MSINSRRTRCVRAGFASLAGALAPLAMLAMLPLAAWSQQPPTFRSVNDVRPRIPDELDRPFWRETQSHRGWEIREDQYCVIADTSQDDAKWAAAQVKAAWSNAARLVDRWTAIHREPDFGLNSTQIVIDSQPLRERDAPLTTVNVVGIQTQVYLNVASGQQPLKQQTLRLREAGAFAMLHTAGLDSAAPPWVVQGMATFAAEQGLQPDELKSLRSVKPDARFGGQQWRFERNAQDTLDYPPLDGAQAARTVQFLLQGDDAQHAPAFLAQVRQAWTRAEQSAVRGGQFRHRPGAAQPDAAQPAEGDAGFAQLKASLASQYEAWQQDPLLGQPVFEPQADLAPELVQAEREMLVVLKLQRRLAALPAPRSARVRVTTFDREQGRQVVEGSRPPAPPANIKEFYERLTDPAAGEWATLDVDGSLLLSSDAARLEALLNPLGQRYFLAQNQSRQVLARMLDSQRILQGWLEANPESATRPLARFAVVDLQSQSKVTKFPQPAGAPSGGAARR